MPIPTAVSEFDDRIRRLTAAALLATGQLWDRVSPQAIEGGWATIRAAVAAQLAAAQIGAARAGDGYVPDVLDELGIGPSASARVVPEAFAVGSSGLPLLDVVDSVPRRALRAASQAGPDAGLAAGRRLLEGIVETQVVDAGRLASSVRMAATPAVQWYVRMVEAGACSRCVVLAGRRYRTLEPFLRHKRCHCKHIPAQEDTADSHTTDPRAYFNSLSKAEQDKAFTLAGAQAIRDGAEINQVVNARRGALGLTPAGARLTAAEKQALRGGNEQFGHLQRTRVFGQDVFVTTEGVTRRGIAGQRLGNFGGTRAEGQRLRTSRTPRLMPESIYELAGGDRGEALRLLRAHGYLRSDVAPRRSGIDARPIRADRDPGGAPQRRESPPAGDGPSDRDREGLPAARSTGRASSALGDRLHVTASRTSEQAVADLDQVAVSFLEAIRRHEVDVWIGPGMVPDQDDLGYLRREHPRGWAPDATFDQVAGAYVPTGKVLAIGDGAHGSHSIALHEGGHAIDEAIGRWIDPFGSERGWSAASSLPQWRGVYEAFRDVAGDRLRPYYAQTQGGRQEMWAEAHAVWASHRERPRRDARDALALTLTGRTATSRAALDALDAVLDYFDAVDRKVAEALTAEG